MSGHSIGFGEEIRVKSISNMRIIWGPEYVDILTVKT